MTTDKTLRQLYSKLWKNMSTSEIFENCKKFNKKRKLCAQK